MAIADALSSPADGTVILRTRLLLHDGDPVEPSWSYYPSEIAANSPLAARTKISGGAPQALAALGYPTAHQAQKGDTIPAGTHRWPRVGTLMGHT